MQAIITVQINDISIEMRTIKGLVSNLPQGQREPFTTCHSYVSLSDYERYLED